MSYSVALSEHPDPGVATGEAVGQIMEAFSTPPDVVLLWVTEPFASHLKSIADTVQQLLETPCLMGVVAETVLANHQEISGTPAVLLWAGHTETARPFSIHPGDLLPQSQHDGDALLLFYDADFHYMAELLDDHPSYDWITGGSSSAKQCSLILNGQPQTSGAVGLVFPTGSVNAPRLTTACRPIGDPFIITARRGPLIELLGGRPAMERLDAARNSLPEEDQNLLPRRLFIGQVERESKSDFQAGDFLIRPVVGKQENTGAIAIGYPIETGATVQFQISNPEVAIQQTEEKYRHWEADSLLCFVSKHRGKTFFDEEGKEAELLLEALGFPTIAGMYCTSEIGPTATFGALHYCSTSTLLFSARE